MDQFNAWKLIDNLFQKLRSLASSWKSAAASWFTKSDENDLDGVIHSPDDNLVHRSLTVCSV
jgi:hypothetical protein